MNEGQRGPRGAGRPRRRSREEASEALIEAASALFAERGSRLVTVRDIAARAGVNANYIHRYFGSKDDLMRAAMERAQERVAARIEEATDIVEDAAAIVRATLAEHQLLSAMARATLDGVYEGVPPRNPAMARLLERFRQEAAHRGGEGRHDPRFVVACLSAATAGYALLGAFIRSGAELDDTPEDEVEAGMVAVLRDVGRLAFRE